jgi:hypothetical protein
MFYGIGYQGWLSLDSARVQPLYLIPLNMKGNLHSDPWLGPPVVTQVLALTGMAGVPPIKTKGTLPCHCLGDILFRQQTTSVSVLAWDDCRFDKII